MGIAQQTYGAVRARVPRSWRSTVAGGVEAVGRGTSSVRMLPKFLIVGGQRCGTNSLYEYLVANPAIGRALPQQEVHFFDTNFSRGIRWYRGHFPTRAWGRVASLRSGHRAVTGESSPYYMFHPLAPERIAATLPDVRLLVLLRDPVDRAYSHYHHERSRGNEVLTFEEALEREPERLAGETERLLADPGYTSFSHQHHAYVARGLYIDQLEVLWDLFPHDRISIVLSERLFADPGVVEAEALASLGLPPLVGHAHGRHNAGRYEDLAGALRRRLADRFAEPNDRLARRLGFDPPWS